jgi:hydroxypyruvate isomerase
MERRKFIRDSFLSGAAIWATGQFTKGGKEISVTETKPFNLDYAFHDGMFKNNRGQDFLDQIRWAHDQGFRSTEDNGMTFSRYGKVGKEPH